MELLKGIRENQEQNIFNICPRCGEQQLRNPLILNSVSKVDNKTYICEFCGQEESNSIGFKNMPVENWWRVQANKIISEDNEEQKGGKIKMFELKCEKCGFKSGNLDEVCYYDINGNSHSDEQDIENNLQNPDALAHVLCQECAEKFDFNK